MSKWTPSGLGALYCVFALPGAVFGQDVPVRTAVTEIAIESHVLGERRPVLVFLPPSYAHTAERFPVLVVLDGDGPGATRAMSVVTGLQDLLTGHVPELIVVAIPNRDRSRDLVPPPAGRTTRPTESVGLPAESRGDRFLAFLEEELLPEVDRRYRTQPARFLFGHSYGGLFAIFAFVTRPSLFSGIVASSPALWVDGQSWNDALRTSLARRPSTRQRLYVAAGEFDPKSHTSSLAPLRRMLGRGAPAALHWRVEQLPGVDHHTVSPAALERGLRFLFADFDVRFTDLARMTPDEVRAHYRRLAESYGWPVRTPMWVWTRMVLAKDALGRPWQESVDAARAMSRDNPWSPNGYIAQAYFLGSRDRDLPGAIAAAESAVRAARQLGDWPGEVEALLTALRKLAER